MCVVRSVIPRRIIQTAKSQDVDKYEQAAIANIKLLNPDYEYVFFDDKEVERFMEKYFPQYIGTFNSFSRSIQRYDLFRYLAVLQYGGFYFDLDVFLCKKLDALLECGCVFPFEELSVNIDLKREYNQDWDLGNYGFGATAGHPFIRAVVENIIKASHDPDWTKRTLASIPRLFRKDYEVLATTGPWIVSRTFAEKASLQALVTVLMPSDVRDRSQWHQFGSFGVHIMRASWRRKDGVVLRKLINWWGRRRLRIALRQSARLGSRREGLWGVRD